MPSETFFQESAFADAEVPLRRTKASDCEVMRMAAETTQRLNPAALTVDDAARTLGISIDMLRADLEAGAPTNSDGTVNLVHYAAWVNREMVKTDVP